MKRCNSNNQPGTRVRRKTLWGTLAGAIITAATLANEPVPVFLGRNIERNGYDGGPELSHLSLENKYKDPIESYGSLILTSPTIANGYLYGAASVFDPPDTYGSVLCLDAETMTPRWRVEEIILPSSNESIELHGCVSSPAVTADGKYVVIGQGLHNDKNSHLLCFETLTGKLHWAIPSELHIESSPVIDGDLVVVGCGAIEDNKSKLPIGNPGYVMAVRISDGELLWKYSIADPESSAAILNDTVYVGSGKNGRELLALRMASDTELKEQRLDRVIWRTSSPLPITSPITLSHGLVIAGSGNGTYSRSEQNSQGMVIAADQKTGEIKWKLALRDSVFGSIAVKGSTGIVTCKSGEIVNVDILTGNVLWKRTPKPGHSIIAGSAFSGNYVYTVTTSGYLMVLDATKAGKTLQYLYLNNPERNHIDYSVSTPSLVNGRLYVGSESGGVRSYSAK